MYQLGASASPQTVVSLQLLIKPSVSGDVALATRLAFCNLKATSQPNRLLTILRCGRGLVILSCLMFQISYCTPCSFQTNTHKKTSGSSGGTSRPGEASAYHPGTATSSVFPNTWSPSSPTKVNIFALLVKVNVYSMLCAFVCALCLTFVPY